MKAARRLSPALMIPLAAVLIGGGVVSQAATPARISAGTYRGKLRCIGSDRFSNGAATRHYRSSPAASVVFGAHQRLRRWTYLFLGRRNLAIQSHAVRAGQSFSYAAGTHIGRPGRTRVTVDEASSFPGNVTLIAHLDWASPSTGYAGSGTYALLLERLGARTIRYEAVKVVVKQPTASAPTAANPVVRRNEQCVGRLSG